MLNPNSFHVFLKGFNKKDILTAWAVSAVKHELDGMTPLKPVCGSGIPFFPKGEATLLAQSLLLFFNH